MRNPFLILLVLAFVTVAAKAREKTLYTFARSDSPSGAEAYGGLARDAAGNLYGTTVFGGATGNGIVFELVASAGWSETILYNFAGGTDGSWPVSAPVLDSAGNLYGTTLSGGKFGAGTVYRLTPSQSDWTEKILWDFNGKDGNAPGGDLVFDGSGNLYGTTELGGGTCDCGTAYELSPKETGKWKLTVLHHFTGGSDGGTPCGGLTLDAAGNLYGTTYNGGLNGGGVIFELASSGAGWSLRPVFNFDGSNGAYSTSKLVLDQSGNLYGTAWGGGAAYEGAVFELNPQTGTETTIYNFRGAADGAAPAAGLTFDLSGNLIGTTTMAGRSGFGTVFELTPSNGSWRETTLYSFTGQADGDTPESGVILDFKGHAFGTTSGMQGASAGSVYEIVLRSTTAP